ncbi:MAG TPA: hypothetical protein VKT77_16310 [Chthonomonadaceae bacterium]|nr:hypothetical protein [Chthonomonadaceae bacterium]
MWVFTKSRDEHDHRTLLNLDLGSRISVTVLGERWFIDVMQASDTVSIAQVGSEEEAKEIFRRIYDALAKGENAIDLDARPAEPEASGDRASRPTPAGDGPAPTD